MHLYQKSFFYRIDAKISNGQLCYKQTAFFSTTSKVCPLYNLGDTLYEYHYKNIGIGIFAAVMLIGVAIVLVDMLFRENTLDNLLFYAIPSTASWIVFFLTMQKRLYIDSKVGNFDFFSTQEAADFLTAVLDERISYTNYAMDTINTLSFDAFIADLKQKCAAQHIDKKGLPVWVDSYAETCLKCPCPICNTRKGINALTIGTAFGLIINTVVHDEVVIGCEECMKTAVKKAAITSLCLGIWSVPWGLFIPPLAIWKNRRRLKAVQMHIPSKALKKHIIKLLQEK